MFNAFIKKEEIIMEIRNGYIISENSENPQEKLQNYLIETVQDTKIIYAIIWGENEAVKKAVTYADDIAEPGDFAPDGFLYKVIYIPNHSILHKYFVTLLSTHPTATQEQITIDNIMGMTYSQAHNRIINYLQNSENITSLEVREMYLSK